MRFYLRRQNFTSTYWQSGVETRGAIHEHFVEEKILESESTPGLISLMGEGLRKVALTIGRHRGL
jgi:hypothetical protein